MFFDPHFLSFYIETFSNKKVGFETLISWLIQLSFISLRLSSISRPEGTNDVIIPPSTTLGWFPSIFFFAFTLKNFLLCYQTKSLLRLCQWLFMVLWNSFNLSVYWLQLVCITKLTEEPFFHGVDLYGFMLFSVFHFQ